MEQPPTYDQLYNKNEKFKQIIGRHEINADFADKLQQLQGYEIVVVCDDSGSMNSPVIDGTGRQIIGMTRWTELKQTVTIVVEIASLMDTNGIDVYFLNRDPVLNTVDAAQLDAVFARPPAGGTNIARVLKQILHDKRDEVKERKLLIVVATDGLAQTDRGHDGTAELEALLKHERPIVDRTFVTFLMCTDDDAVVDIYNKWDAAIKNVDVVDDYVSERKEILRAQGSHFKFSFGDYVVKMLLGSIDPYFDKLDELPRPAATIVQTQRQPIQSDSDCCIIL